MRRVCAALLTFASSIWMITPVTSAPGACRADFNRIPPGTRELVIEIHADELPRAITDFLDEYRAAARETPSVDEFVASYNGFHSSNSLRQRYAQRVSTTAHTIETRFHLLVRRINTLSTLRRPHAGWLTQPDAGANNYGRCLRRELAQGLATLPKSSHLAIKPESLDPNARR